jgi:hypothetical protein
MAVSRFWPAGDSPPLPKRQMLVLFELLRFDIDSLTEKAIELQSICIAPTDLSSHTEDSTPQSNDNSNSMNVNHDTERISTPHCKHDNPTNTEKISTTKCTNHASSQNVSDDTEKISVPVCKDGNLCMAFANDAKISMTPTEHYTKSTKLSVSGSLPDDLQEKFMERLSVSLERYESKFQSDLKRVNDRIENIGKESGVT